MTEGSKSLTIQKPILFIFILIGKASINWEDRLLCVASVAREPAGRVAKRSPQVMGTLTRASNQNGPYHQAALYDQHPQLVAIITMRYSLADRASQGRTYAFLVAWRHSWQNDWHSIAEIFRKTPIRTSPRI